MDQKIVNRKSFIIPVLPAIALALIIIFQRNTLLDYAHVLSGGTWTGIDLFMGLVVGRILSRLSNEARVEFIRQLIPVMLFVMPTLASVTITAGIYLAISMGIFSLSHIAFIAAGIIVIILLVQGFGIFLPNEVRIVLELNKESPEVQKISRLASINFKLAGVQAFFQFAIIFVMANIAMGNLNLYL